MKKLYRSRRLRVIGGVAGGLSEYFDLDVTLVRLAIALLTVITPNIILAYILAWIIIPEAPKTAPSTGQAGAGPVRQDEASARRERREDSSPPEATPQPGGEALPPTAGEILASVGLDQSAQPEDLGAAEGADGQDGKAIDSEDRPVEDGSPDEGAEPKSKPQPKLTQVDRNKQFFGYLLIVIGVLYLLRKHVSSFWLRLPVQFIRTWWPIAIIAIGVAIVVGVIRRDT
ncbi:MAG: PspC domain-containing protein [Bacillota bacterium]|jgi:phage shock protein PspC (stress-responsive transcriptional regulator)